MSLPDISTLKDRFSHANIQRSALGRVVNSAVGRNILDLSFVNARSEIGILQLDALLTESFSGSSTVTAYPTESGFPITDNVAHNSDTLHIEGVVTGIFPLTMQYSNLYAVGTARLAKARDMLKAQHDSGLPITVLTGLNLYQDVVITAYSVERNADEGEQITVSVDLVHIRKATATETAVPEAYAKKADDMSNRGTEGSENEGATAASVSEKAGETRTNVGKAGTEASANGRGQTTLFSLKKRAGEALSQLGEAKPVIVINLADHNDFITEVLLDGQVYFLHFGWNSEWRQWEMGIENTRNERIVAGVPVNPFTDILGAYRRLAIPQGAFIVLLENGDTLGRQSFVTGLASLIYLTAEERDNANGNLVQALLRD